MATIFQNKSIIRKDIAKVEITDNVFKIVYIKGEAILVGFYCLIIVEVS